MSLQVATFACQKPASFFSRYNYRFCNAALRLQREEKTLRRSFSLRPPAFVYWSLGINHCQVILKSQNNETVTEWAQIAASTYMKRGYPCHSKWARRQSRSVQCLCALDVHMHAFVHMLNVCLCILFNFSACVCVLCVLAEKARQLFLYLFSRQFYPLALPRA